MEKKYIGIVFLKNTGKTISTRLGIYHISKLKPITFFMPFSIGLEIQLLR